METTMVVTAGREARHQAVDARVVWASAADDEHDQRKQARRVRAPLSLRWRLTGDGLIGVWESAAIDEQARLAS